MYAASIPNGVETIQIEVDTRSRRCMSRGYSIRSRPSGACPRSCAPTMAPSSPDGRCRTGRPGTGWNCASFSRANPCKTRTSRASTAASATNACHSTGSPASATCAASSTTGTKTTTTTGRTAPWGTCRRPGSRRNADITLTALRHQVNPCNLLRFSPRTLNRCVANPGGSTDQEQSA